MSTKGRAPAMTRPPTQPPTMPLADLTPWTPALWHRGGHLPPRPVMVMQVLKVKVRVADLVDSTRRKGGDEGSVAGEFDGCGWVLTGWDWGVDMR